MQFSFGTRITYDLIAGASDSTGLDEVLTADVIVAADGTSFHIKTSLGSPQSNGSLLSRNLIVCASRPIPRQIFKTSLYRSIRNSDHSTKGHVTVRRKNCVPRSATHRQRVDGPKRHVVAYTITNMQLYNLVLCGPGKASVGTYNEPADLEEVQSQYTDFEETVQQVIAKADRCHKWMLSEVPALILDRSRRSNSASR